jgi:hypothetical protein
MIGMNDMKKNDENEMKLPVIIVNHICARLITSCLTDFKRLILE